MIPSLLAQPRLAGLAVVAVSVGALAVALASQHWGGLQPCILCIYQRYAYGAAIIAGLGAVVLDAWSVGGRGLGRLCVGLAGLAFLAGAGIALFHVGVEQHWWRGTAGCHAPALDAGLSVDQLREQLMATEFVPCDRVPWAVLGISIAGFNALASLALASLAFWSYRASARARTA